jgi:hypothetical protein
MTILDIVQRHHALIVSNMMTSKNTTWNPTELIACCIFNTPMVTWENSYHEFYTQEA